MIRFRLGARVPRTLGASLAFAAAVVLDVSAAAAQQRFQTVGPTECLNCHDHQNERQWYEKQEIPEVQRRFPAKGSNAGHINALKQLETPKSNDFARAIGLQNKYDLNGACVKCHATVFQGDANAGVSCESCHGAASGYLKPHQSKGAYATSVSLGLVDLVGKVPAWAQQCASCHVMDDQRLVAAGHPSGDDFELGEKFGPVSLHFKKKYSAGDVSVISREIVRGIIARRRGGRPPAIAPGGAAVVTPPSTTSIPPVVEPQRDRGPDTSNVGARGAPAPAGSRSTGSSAAAAPRTSAESITSVSASLARVQGRLIEVLTEMLQRGTTVPVRTGTPPPTLAPYEGPDRALLELQREAIALAMEILGAPPASPARSAPPR
jgi:hypothetical protein